MLARWPRASAIRQVRNWGTIGGSCAHADPASDWPALLIAARAYLVCQQHRRRAGRRRARLLHRGLHDRHRPNEMLTEVRIPDAAARTGGAYLKLERRAGDFATVGVGGLPSPRRRRPIADVGIGLTAVAGRPSPPPMPRPSSAAHPERREFRRGGGCRSRPSPAGRATRAARSTTSARWSAEMTAARPPPRRRARGARRLREETMSTHHISVTVNGERRRGRRRAAHSCSSTCCATSSG